MKLPGVNKLKKSLESKAKELGVDKVIDSAVGSVGQMAENTMSSAQKAVRGTTDKINELDGKLKERTSQLDISGAKERLSKVVSNVSGEVGTRVTDISSKAIEVTNVATSSAMAVGSEVMKTAQELGIDQMAIDASKKVAEAAVATGDYAVKAGKVVSGVQAVEDRKKANSAKEEADGLKLETDQKTEEIRQKTNEALVKFGETRLRSLRVAVKPFLVCIERLGKNYNTKEYEFLKDIDLTPEEVDEMKSVEMTASTAFKSAMGPMALAGAALTGVPVAVTTAVGALATASTGTAISTLSGAAASNAVLAWLGGGAVAAGGGGVATGAAVLATITWASAGVVAIASAGIIASAFYSKKYTEATKYLADVKEYRSKMELGWTMMEGVIKRVEELDDITEKLTERAQTLITTLSSDIDKYLIGGEMTPQLVKSFQEAALVVKSLSEMAQVPILDEQGNLNESSSLIIGKTEKLLNTEL